MRVEQDKNIEQQIAIINLKAQKKSEVERDIGASLMQLSHLLGCHNITKAIGLSEVGALKLSGRLIDESALAIGKTPQGVFFLAVLFQPNVWKAIKNLKLRLAIIEVKQQRLALRFTSHVVGQYKPSGLFLSFPISSHSLWDKIVNQKIEFATVGESYIHPISDTGDVEISCNALQSYCAPIVFPKNLKRKVKLHDIL